MPAGTSSPTSRACTGIAIRYSEETLARAIRDGVDSEGRPLGYLMPRYALGDADMAALIDYLKQISVRHVPA